jgi:hypothetical protein
MKLWTWHTRDFSLVDGHVDHERSEYVQTVCGITDAYRKLAGRLGTDQIVWCYTKSDQYLVTPGNARVEWVLDVPQTEILECVDENVWNRILKREGRDYYVPREKELEWRTEAIQRSIDLEHHIESRRREYWDQPPPDGDRWSELFVAKESGENVSALIRHPVPKEWVSQRPA